MSITVLQSYLAFVVLHSFVYTHSYRIIKKELKKQARLFI